MVRITEAGRPGPLPDREPTPKSAELNRSVEMTRAVAEKTVLYRYSPTESRFSSGAPDLEASAKIATLFG
ncbi:MAG: hypothetical protein KR126chlam1_00547 [Chlamydiae bacterium]|nr:hypothetical protein [Chlamydiota bacterium]